MKDPDETRGIRITGQRRCTVFYVNISELSRMVGCARETAMRRLEGMRFILRGKGPKAGKYFPSYRAIPVILGHRDPGDSPIDKYGDHWPKSGGRDEPEAGGEE